MYFICFFLQRNRSALRDGLCNEILIMDIATKNNQTNKHIGFGEKSMLQNNQKLLDYEDLVIELMIYNGFRSCSDETKHLLRKLMITYWHIDDDEAVISLEQILRDLQQSIKTFDFLKIRFVMLYYLYSDSRFRKFEAILYKVLGKCSAQIDPTNVLEFKLQPKQKTKDMKVMADKEHIVDNRNDLVRLIGDSIVYCSKENALCDENCTLIANSDTLLRNLTNNRTEYEYCVNLIAKSTLIKIIYDSKSKLIPHDAYQKISFELVYERLNYTLLDLVQWTRHKAALIDNLFSREIDVNPKMTVKEIE